MRAIGPVSRVLSWTAIYLGGTVAGPLHATSSETVGQTSVSSTVLLRIEFTAPDSLQPASELLPHFSTLAPPARGGFPLPLAIRVRGGTCSRCCGAVPFCCTFPEVAFGGRYPLSLPCGARTFLTVGLSAVPRGCPARLQRYFSLISRNCQSFFRQSDPVFRCKSGKKPAKRYFYRCVFRKCVL